MLSVILPLTGLFLKASGTVVSFIFLQPSLETLYPGLLNVWHQLSLCIRLGCLYVVLESLQLPFEFRVRFIVFI